MDDSRAGGPRHPIEGRHDGADGLDRAARRRGGGTSALEESEIRYRTLFEASTDAVFVENLHGEILDCNATAVSMFGYAKDELASMKVWDLLPAHAIGSFANEVLPRLLQGRAVFETENVRKGGSAFPVEVSARVVEIQGDQLAVVVVRDITERKKAEEERRRMEARLRQQQKLEAIGTLASGVAHEINNPLGVVMNCGRIIAGMPEIDATVRQLAEQIATESARIAAIVKGLLAFARREPGEESVTRPRDFVESTLSLVRAALVRDEIAIDVDVPEQLPALSCRPQQIQQVLVNLLTNARDALNERYPDRDEGKRVAIRGRVLEEGSAAWVRITVEDLGTGIEDGILERIFDPFFTTKPKERGTGLGLAVSHGIVAEHGGRLLVETSLGEWTRFHVDLPLDPARGR
jgi:PAS domain S-box-containing protein